MSSKRRPRKLRPGKRRPTKPPIKKRRPDGSHLFHIVYLFVEGRESHVESRGSKVIIFTKWQFFFLFRNFKFSASNLCNFTSVIEVKLIAKRWNWAQNGEIINNWQLRENIERGQTKWRTKIRRRLKLST